MSYVLSIACAVVGWTFVLAYHAYVPGTIAILGSIITTVSAILLPASPRRWGNSE